MFVIMYMLLTSCLIHIVSSTGFARGRMIGLDEVDSQSEGGFTRVRSMSFDYDDPFAEVRPILGRLPTIEEERPKSKYHVRFNEKANLVSIKVVANGDSTKSIALDEEDEGHQEVITFVVSEIALNDQVKTE